MITFRTLQVRLFLTYLAIIVVTLGLAALSLFLLIGFYRDSISYTNLEDVGRLMDSQAHSSIRDSQNRGETLRDTDFLLGLRSLLNGPAEDGGETSVAVVDASGRVIDGLSASSKPLDGSLVPGFDPASLSPARNPRRCRVEVPEGQDLLCVSLPMSENLRQAIPNQSAAGLIIAQPAADLATIYGDLLPRLTFSGLIGLAAALVLGFLLSQSVSAPLRNIARAARSVARGNYRQRVPVTGPSEVRDLATQFNLMTEQVQRSQQTLRDFLANISHELKTPLTSIRGFSEAVLDGTIDDPDGIQRSARVISGESNRLLRLVEGLLDLSRIESGQVVMNLQDFSLRELADQVGEVFALRSEESGVALLVDAENSLRVNADFDRLEQVLSNLVDNAIRHTPGGGSVTIRVRELRAGLAEVSVSDTGSGIDPRDVPHLFDRFYRANGATPGKGYGLGLAIAREIVRAHGGDIWATSTPGNGSAFVFTLPALVQAPAAQRRRTRRESRAGR